MADEILVTSFIRPEETVAIDMEVDGEVKTNKIYKAGRRQVLN